MSEICVAGGGLSRCCRDHGGNARNWPSFLTPHLYNFSMPEPYLALDFVCPVCGAKTQEKCKLTTGAPRFESHIERRYIAKDRNLKRSRAKPPAGSKPPKG